jgi:hypothetical protein
MPFMHAQPPKGLTMSMAFEKLLVYWKGVAFSVQERQSIGRDTVWGLPTLCDFQLHERGI